MKIAIIYHSETGNTRRVAEIIARGAMFREEIEVKTMSIDEVDEEFVGEAKAVIFGCPTYCGTFSWQMKRWFDTGRINLNDKMGSVFATEKYLGGGADLAMLGMIGHLLIKGMLVFANTKGGPITHYGVVTIGDGDEEQRGKARFFGERVARKAWQFFGNADRV